jgi:nudix-type nucleoside diphosphatase (YffH/AdpP family)
MTPTSVFLFGTLRDDNLRARVLGADLPAQPARLPDHCVTDAGDAGQPRLTAAAGAVADGLLVALDDPALARLDFYESLFNYARVPVVVDVAGQRVPAQLYAPATPATAGLRPWSLAEWQARYGAPARRAAVQVFALSAVYGPEALRVRYPMLLAHSASQTRAAAEPPAQAVRRNMAAGDVLSRQTTHPYAYFFGVQVDDLQFRRFDGTLSPVVRRAGFVMSDAVTVLPYDPVRDCVMVIEQFRYGLFIRNASNCWVLEPIAGRIDPGEAPLTAALREMVEEARLDLRAEDLVAIGGSYPSPGAISEYLFHYIALCDLPDTRRGVAGLESEAEDIRSHILPLDDALHMITTGEAQNGPLIQSLYWLALNRDRLRAGVNR